MPNTYRLINPHVEGNLKTKIKADNSQEAANTLYKTLSEHFNNSVPVFLFSIQKGSSGSGKTYHFKVTEKTSDNKEVSFTIAPLTVKGGEPAMKKFQQKLEVFKNKMKQAGGKKHKSKKDKKKSKDSDSSDISDSSDSYDFYKRALTYLPETQPIYYWWYDPYVYRMDSVYIPTFYSYFTPYIELSLNI